MEIKRCDCCKKLTMRLYNVEQYTDTHRFMCSACFITLIKYNPRVLENPEINNDADQNTDKE